MKIIKNKSWEIIETKFLTKAHILSPTAQWRLTLRDSSFRDIISLQWYSTLPMTRKAAWSCLVCMGLLSLPASQPRGIIDPWGGCLCIYYLVLIPSLLEYIHHLYVLAQPPQHMNWWQTVTPVPSSDFVAAAHCFMVPHTYVVPYAGNTQVCVSSLTTSHLLKAFWFLWPVVILCIAQRYFLLRVLSSTYWLFSGFLCLFLFYRVPCNIELLFDVWSSSETCQVWSASSSSTLVSPDHFPASCSPAAIIPGLPLLPSACAPFYISILTWCFLAAHSIVWYLYAATTWGTFPPL